MSKPDLAIRFALAKEGWFESRFLPKTVVDPVFGCRLWVGTKSPDGYGLIAVTVPSPAGGAGKSVLMRAHRVAFAQAYGFDALPSGGRGLTSDRLVVDHKCNNPCCVEPTHLRKIPQGLNYWRGLERTDHPWQLAAR